MNELDPSEDWRRNPAVIRAAWDRVDPSVRDAILDWNMRRGQGNLRETYKAQGDLFAKVARTANELAFEIGFDHAPDGRNLEVIQGRLHKSMLKCFEHLTPPKPAPGSRQEPDPRMTRLLIKRLIGLTVEDLLPKGGMPEAMEEFRRSPAKYADWPFKDLVAKFFPPEVWPLDPAQFSAIANNNRRVADMYWRLGREKLDPQQGHAQPKTGRRPNMNRRRLLLIARENGLRISELARQIADMGIPATNDDYAPSAVDRNSEGGQFLFRSEAEFKKEWEGWAKRQAGEFQELFQGTKKLGRKRVYRSRREVHRRGGKLPETI
jgi:hypothetical protein